MAEVIQSCTNQIAMIIVICILWSQSFKASSNKNLLGMSYENKKWVNIMKITITSNVYNT